MKKLLLCFSLIALSSTINAQWTSQATGFSAASRGLNEIKIVDANTVWALAYDGSGLGANIQEFTRTTDGGSTWTAGTIDVGNTVWELNNISPISATTAWVSAINNITGDANNGVGYISKTSDGGVTWTPQCETCFQVAGSSFLNGVYFWNANVGVAYGDPEGTEFEIWRTTDGGTNWTQVPGASIANPLSGEYGYNSSPIAAGGTLWFPTNKGRLFKTTDQGATWTAAQVTGLADFSGIDATTGNGTRADAYFSDANTGFLLKTVVGGTTTAHTYTRTFRTTSNGGTTWGTSAPFTGTHFILNYIPGTTTMVATSQAAPVGTSVSTDNGATWTDLEPTGIEQRGASAFLNLTTGWCAGFSTDPLTDGVFKLTGALGTQNFENATKFKVYPNPASSMVTISAANTDSYKLSVTDITGKVVMTKSLNGIENTLDISSLSTGAYFFELSSENIKDVVKILKN
jgi:hypothetical protein